MEVREVPIEIRRDNLSDARTQGLVHAHFAALSALTPAESCHVLDLDQLRGPGIQFWSAAATDPRVLHCGTATT